MRCGSVAVSASTGRGLDALRRSGWRGQGPVPWEHEPNRGFLRALAALAPDASIAVLVTGVDRPFIQVQRTLDQFEPEVVKVALVVDPQRDVDRVLAVAEREGVRITHVFETHIHNDYVTGGLALARRLGARYHVNAEDEVSFGREPIRDGDVVEGIATVDESAITGESAPVVRESGGDRSAVTGGTRVLSDEIVVRITAKPGETFDAEHLQAIIQRRAPIYDKGQDGHYNLISALHKSVRGSDPDAALYYLCRMLDAGEDPLYLGRRLVRMAVEDIGLADPQALGVANAAKDAYDYLGSPEGELALAQAAVYLATAPKSNALYTAYKAAMRTAREGGSLLPPRQILNAPTKLMKEEGYGSGYRYDHDEPDAFSGQNYFPEELGRQSFYRPVPRGAEREIGKRMAEWARLRRERGEP